MFLSRIQLTEAIASDSQLGKLLHSNSYGMHRLLWDLFDGSQRFLFREERSAEQLHNRCNRPLYYVLSATAPSNQSPLFAIESKPFTPALQAGDTLGFKLRANPTIARRASGAKSSKRHDIVMDAQRQWLENACSERGLSTEGTKGQLKSVLQSHPDFQGRHELLEQALAEAIEVASHNWLKDRGIRHGFELQSIQTTAYRWNSLPEKGRDAGFSSLDYEGVLAVANPEQFIESITKGIGPAKAFGCGLMLIRRL